MLRATLPAAASLAWALLFVFDVVIDSGASWIWTLGVPAAAFLVSVCLLMHAGLGRSGRGTQAAAGLLLLLVPVHCIVTLSTLGTMKWGG